jgi:hypothetical protein
MIIYFQQRASKTFCTMTNVITFTLNYLFTCLLTILQSVQYCIARNTKSDDASKFKYVFKIHRNQVNVPEVSNIPVFSTIVATGVISTDFFYFGMSENVRIKDTKQLLLLRDRVTIGTNIETMKIQHLYDKAALWAVEQFLKTSESIRASNKIIIDMNDRKLCSINDCINYIDINGRCYLDDKSR